MRERSDKLEIYCKAWPVREGKYFHKHAFNLDWERQIIRCPASQEMPFVPGGVVHFPKDICAQCPLKTQCTCIGYLGYPFQNKQGKSCVEHLARDVDKEEMIGVVAIIGALI